MSLLFDQNLSRKLPIRLSTEYPGSEHVIDIGLTDAVDRVIWTYAASHGLVVVSKDADFRDLVLALGPPPKVIWLSVGNGSTNVVEALLRAYLNDVTSFLDDPQAGLLELP